MGKKDVKNAAASSSDDGADKGAETARREQVYQAALKKTRINVWEYDVKRHVLTMLEGSQEYEGHKKQLENIPEFLMSSEYIHPNSKEEIRGLFQKLEQGELSAQADILILGTDRETWWWERISYTLLCGEGEVPAYAVIIGEDISRKKKAEILYQQELKMQMKFNEGMLLSFVCNLNVNRVEYIEGSSSAGYRKAVTYEDILEQQKKAIANEEDHVRFLKAMGRRPLIQAFREGKSRITCEYRCGDDSGRLFWVLQTVQLVRDVQSRELYVYSTLQDINEKKKIELALKRRAERDATTNTYNKDTTIQMVENAIEKSGEKKASYAFLIVNVDNFTDLVHHSGYQKADQVLCELAGQLLTRFTDKKIVGRLYGDEFVVFVYGSPRRENVFRCAEEVRKSMSMPYMFIETEEIVSISVGLVFGKSQEEDFNSLYDKAHKAVEAAKHRGKNCCVIYSEKLSGQGHREPSANAVVPSKVSERQGQELGGLLVKCLFTLTGSMEFEKSLEKALEHMGKFYRSDRAYVVGLPKGKESPGKVYEWKKENLPSVKNRKRELVQLARLGIQGKKGLQSAWYLKDADALEAEYPELCDMLRQSGIRSLFLTDLEERGETVGLFGIGNPENSIEKTVGIEALRYLLANELLKHSLREKQAYLSCHDTLTGVWNRNSFKEYSSSLNEEELISMGVVSIDINGLKEINRFHGNRYGDLMVQSLAFALQQEFEEGRIYRFAGDEFLVVCENIVEDAFREKTKKVREKLSKQACRAAVGAAWSDSDPNLETLMDIADERRQIAKQEYYLDKHYNHKRQNADVVKDLVTSMGEKKFCIYLQPKINIQDNTLYGAEALIRYRDSSHGLVSPGKFVPYLENAGLIYLIDYFVLEEVYKLMARWEREGKKKVPVSLNFSRSTLLEDNLMDKMEEISARHEADRQYIEIEITESFGEIERNAVARIGSQIHQLGYQLALDDFGSMYSNLTFLSDLPLNNLKLDKSLINGLVSGKNSRIIIKNMLNLCQELEINVVAEGVESTEQLEILKTMGCICVQGYYYNKPMPVEEFEMRYMEEKNPD